MKSKLHLNHSNILITENEISPEESHDYIINNVPNAIHIHTKWYAKGSKLLIN